jgi:hypothetical protein
MASAYISAPPAFSFGGKYVLTIITRLLIADTDPILAVQNINNFTEILGSNVAHLIYR